jgi:hypothetical protein
MRTSARKISALFARIEKEISRASDRAVRVGNFTRIARSRTSALGANARDPIFSRSADFFSRCDLRAQIFFRDRKNIFRSQWIFEESP